MEGTGGPSGSDAPPIDESAEPADPPTPPQPDRPGVARRLAWWVAGPLLTAALLAVSVVMLVAPRRGSPQPEPADLMALVLTFVLAGALLFRRRWPVETTLISAVAVAAFAARSYPLTLLVFAPGLCAAAAIYRCSPRRALWSVLAAVVGLGTLAVVGAYPGTDVTTVLVFAVVAGAVALVARAVRLVLLRRRSPGASADGPVAERRFLGQPPPVVGWPDSPTSWAVVGGGALVIVSVVTVAFVGVLAVPLLPTGDDQVLAVGLGFGGATGAAASDDGSVYATGVFGGPEDVAAVVQVRRFDSSASQLGWTQAIDADPLSLPVASARPAVASGGPGPSGDQIAVAWLEPVDDVGDGTEATEPPAPAATIAVFDEAGNPRWIDSFGTGESVFLLSAPVGLPDGGFAVAGAVNESLDGSPLRGPSDAFVRSYRADGSVRWTRQFGTDDRDGAVALAADGSGNLYVAGGSYGSLEPGATGAFLTQVDGDSTIGWTRQFGVDQLDVAVAVAADEQGGAYVVSGVGDGFRADRNRITAFASDGSRRWEHRHDVTGSGIDQVAVLDGLVFASGCERRTLLGVGVGVEQGVVLEVSEDGAEVVRELGSADGGCIRTLAPGPDGRLLVGGSTEERLGGSWFLVEIDPG